MKKLLSLTILMLLIVACGPSLDFNILYELGWRGAQQVAAEPTAEAPTAITTPTITPKPTKTTRPTATALPPELRDFDLLLIVLEKRCFGSAGCIITVRPELIFIDIRYPYDRVEIPPDKIYTLIYEIYGGEDGTLTFNLTITGDRYSFNEERIMTAHKNDELTVKAVRLLKEDQ